jgi:uncharacterized damage-inducible protein DinB
MSDKTTALLASLASARRHVLGILEGLDEEALRRPVLPSGWSCLGLVNHLALDVERFWFRGVVAGDQEVVDDVAGEPSEAWRVGPEASAASVLEGYRRACAASDAVLAATSPDAPPAWWPEQLFGGWRHDDVQAVVLHVLVETATHAGHLDAARELIDGRTWMVLD